jgi:hypothetical protein
MIVVRDVCDRPMEEAIRKGDVLDNIDDKGKW